MPRVMLQVVFVIWGILEMVPHVNVSTNRDNGRVPTILERRVAYSYIGFLSD